MKYKVFLHQYVEEIAVIEVEANSPEEARDKALLDPSDADWQDGDDMYSAKCYCVKDINNNEVWEAAAEPEMRGPP